MPALGHIVEVDLTSGRITARRFTADEVQRCLGGFGFNTEWLHRTPPPPDGRIDPAGPLVISCGLLAGSPAPSSSRTHLSARSPQSGFMGSSNVGGGFGARLRAGGLQALVITGTAAEPVCLHCSPAGVRIVEAGDLWGLDTYQTHEELRRRLGDDKAETLAIGPAGEHRVPYACVMAGIDHAAGRTGLGAVMGAKGLKAVAAQGGSRRAAADPAARAAVTAYLTKVKAGVSRLHDFSTWGSAGDILEFNAKGMMGTRNYRQPRFEHAACIDGRHLKQYVSRGISCPRCMVHCKAEVRLTAGRYAGLVGGRPEYESIMALGALCGLGDPEALIHLSNLCNRLGLDTISTGSVVAFAMDLFDRGILTTADTGGLVLEWGSADAMEALMHRIARREGIGAVLAMGVRDAAERIGRGAGRFAYHAKGVEIYGCDPRGRMGLALAFAVSLRGGDFTSVYPIAEVRYSPEKAEREFGTRAAVDLAATQGKGALVRKGMLASAVIDSLGICKIPALSIIGDLDLSNEAELLAGVTGIRLSAEELVTIGERIVAMERLFNLRCGATAADDDLPSLFQDTPIAEGPARGRRVRDLHTMVQDFYHAMGWDNLGVPTAATLARLGLG